MEYLKFKKYEEPLLFKEEVELEKEKEKEEDYASSDYIHKLELETDIIQNKINTKLKELDGKTKTIINNTDIQRNLFSVLTNFSIESIENVERERDNLRLIEDEFGLLLNKKHLEIEDIIEFKRDLIKRKDNFIKKLAYIESKQNDILENIDKIKEKIYNEPLKLKGAIDRYEGKPSAHEYKKEDVEDLISKNEYISFTNMFGGNINNSKKTNNKFNKKTNNKFSRKTNNKFNKKTNNKFSRKTNNKFSRKTNNKNIYIGGTSLVLYDRDIELEKIQEYNNDLYESKDIINNNSIINNISIFTKLRNINKKIKANEQNLCIQNSILKVYNSQLVKQLNKEKEFKKNIIENKKKLIDILNERSNEKYIKEKSLIINKLDEKLKIKDDEIEEYKTLNIKSIINNFIKLYYSIFYNFYINFLVKQPITAFKFYLFLFIKRYVNIEYSDNLFINNLLLYCLFCGVLYGLTTTPIFIKDISLEEKKEIKYELNDIISRYINIYLNKIQNKFPTIFSI